MFSRCQEWNVESRMEFRTNENTAKSLTNLWSTRIFGFYHSTFLCVFWLQRARSPARNQWTGQRGCIKSHGVPPSWASRSVHVQTQWGNCPRRSIPVRLRSVNRPPARPVTGTGNVTGRFPGTRNRLPYPAGYVTGPVTCRLRTKLPVTGLLRDTRNRHRS